MNIQSVISFLSGIPFFESFEEKHMQLIAYDAEYKEFSPGTLFFDLDDPAHRAYVICSGKAILSILEKGNLVDKYEILPGGLVGENALFKTTTRTARVRAAEHCSALVIEQESFLRLLTVYPDLAKCMRAKLLGRLDQFTQTIGRVSAK